MAQLPEQPADDMLRGLLGSAPNQARPVNDDLYLRVWELEQNHTSSRWTITTFFMSVSFAIYGFSFQAQMLAPLPLAARVVALSIFWFAYLIFVRFNVYTRVLRHYLRELEQTGQTQISVQLRAAALMRRGGRRHVSSTRLLLYFGMLYTAGTLVLAWFVP